MKDLLILWARAFLVLSAATLLYGVVLQWDEADAPAAPTVAAQGA